jgi:methylmalonyl-CoA/ethylmalonyl-CoA epimerase
VVGRVARIVVAVRSIEDALAFYRDALGLTVTHDVDLADHELRVVRLGIGELEIELLQPTGAGGPVERFLNENGEGLHHLVIDTQDIEHEMRTLLARGAELIDRKPRPGPDGRVGFVNPRSTGGVLIELIETKNNPHDPNHDPNNEEAIGAEESL